MERDDNQRVALLVAVGSTADGDGWELAVARTAATAVEALRSGHSVALLSGAATLTPRTARDVLDHLSELNQPVTTASEVIAASLRRAGPGAVVIWLSAQPAPPDVAAVVRSAAATLLRAMPTPDSGRAA
jgi:hypothetical protein